jgi:hypothetical protein
VSGIKVRSTISHVEALTVRECGCKGVPLGQTTHELPTPRER